MKTIVEYLLSKNDPKTNDPIKTLEAYMKDDIYNFKHILDIIKKNKDDETISYAVDIIIRLLENDFMLFNEYSAENGFRLGEGNWVPFSKDSKVLQVSVFLQSNTLIIEAANAKLLKTYNMYAGPDEVYMAIADTESFDTFVSKYSMNRYNYKNKINTKKLTTEDKETIDKYIDEIIG